MMQSMLDSNFDSCRLNQRLTLNSGKGNVYFADYLEKKKRIYSKIDP